MDLATEVLLSKFEKFEPVRCRLQAHGSFIAVLKMIQLQSQKTSLGLANQKKITIFSMKILLLGAMKKKQTSVYCEVENNGPKIWKIRPR